MKEYILETKNLSFKYEDGTNALNNISLKIEKGKKIAFLGVNGAGKSTLFLNFNGILKPSSGEVLYKGEKIKYTHSYLNELRKNIGIVFQDPDNQLFSANVYQEVSFGAMNLDLEETEVRKRVDEGLKSVNMYEYKDKAVHFLSYGQKKRVSIADILVMEPEIIIFDESTSSLDPKHAKQIVEIFNEINEVGITVILSTHDVEIAYSWADYIIVMKDGKVVKSGEPVGIFKDDDFIKDVYLDKPIVLEVYEKLVEKGYIELQDNIPRNKDELIKILDNK
ncbi:energy-coupling factor ABC transporter ATP-binding protein [Clostridium novyi]|uniref:ABC transporter ATP-binding protein n=1 Tax=Clostridium novyi (strain NT) TaxID=386415 RepID=A0PYG3_CLONN|nr:ATP-binding cassette domain-containing protein [Clostridium novyi]ABK61447.1 cobalt ABC transporter, ATP-binding protein [Clostridium novyi NT]KEH86688.1 cobalt ABC transporter ATPase [Clostridium novyi A str. NCTC 538]